MGGELASVWWVYVLLGVGAGILSGALGVGSGIVLVPALVLMFHFPQKSAQGTALAVMVPMALLGAARYWLHPQIDLDFAAIGILAGGALIGTLIGTELAGRLPGPALRKVFAIFILVAAARMLLVPGRPKPAKPGGSQPVPQVPAEEKGPDHDTHRQ